MLSNNLKIKEITKIGTIVPLGDGSVGKTAITKVLLNRFQKNKMDLKGIEEILRSTNKSTNIEMNLKTLKTMQG